MKSHQQQQHHHHHQKGATSLFPKWHVINTFSYFFLFACGVAAGVFLNSYLKNVSFDLHLTKFSISPSPSPPTTSATHNNTTAAAAVGGGCENRQEKIVVEVPVPVLPPPPPPAGRVGLSEYLKVAAEAMHDMEEEELLWRASMVAKVKEYPFPRVPKVAFLFLTKGPMLMAPMWELFFKGNQGLYSIYIHSSPSYVASPDESPLFRARRIPSQHAHGAGSDVGEVQHGGSRAAAASQRAPRRRQPAVRPPLRGLHPALQLLHRLRLPHQLQPSLRRGLRHRRRPHPLPPGPHARDHPARLAEGVPVVRDRPRPRPRGRVRQEVLPQVPGLLQEQALLRRRALPPHLLRHRAHGKDVQPEPDLGGLVGWRDPSKSVRERGGDGGVPGEVEEWEWGVFVQWQEDDDLFLVCQEVSHYFVG
ncbi:unnamed protein product [Linum tenue]|uniref:Uncharacterized protein n=1 Tax=Linum tenue TaxID=586396 RepID=A0AAV0N7J5_9ROSI|nr:unnamed protein product [Linum tenue]